MSSSRLGLTVMVVVTVGLLLTYVVLDPLAQQCFAAKQIDPARVCVRHAEYVMVLTLIFSAVLTLFGVLALPNGQDEIGDYREPRIRLAIAMSILVLYLVFFSMAVFWTDPEKMNQKMIDTLTNLMMVVIPFYFGASAVAQMTKRKE